MKAKSSAGGETVIKQSLRGVTQRAFLSPLLFSALHTDTSWHVSLAGVS